MYPTAYLDYLIYFHIERDYFECHEILEEYWKEHDPKKRDSHWVGLIQIAVGLYHHRRGNVNGAIRMYTKARSILEKNTVQLQQLGLNKLDLIKQLDVQILRASDSDVRFDDIALPLSKDVIHACQKRCETLGFEWKTKKDIPTELIHKHTLRDRTDVILERKRQLALKEK